MRCAYGMCGRCTNPGCGSYGQLAMLQPLADPEYGWKDYALVAGVGAALGFLGQRSARATPVLFAAALYVLGFWVRGRPQTPQVLGRGRSVMPAWLPGNGNGAAPQDPGTGPVEIDAAPIPPPGVRVGPVRGYDVLDA